MSARLILGMFSAALAALTLAAGAAGVSATTAFTQPFFNPCTGELLVATGTVVFGEEVSVSIDGRTHERSYMRFKGTSATAPVSGRKYVVQEQTIEGTNSDSDGASSTTHFSGKFHWVRTGETGALIDDDDFYDWWHIHLTVNANGVPTSVKVETEDEYPPCR